MYDECQSLKELGNFWKCKGRVCIIIKVYKELKYGVVQKLRVLNEVGRWSKVPIFVHVQGKECPRRCRKVVKNGQLYIHVVIE